MLLIGAGANRKLTCSMLHAFVDKTGIPFVTTQMGKGVVDERRSAVLGNAALSDDDFVHRAIELRRPDYQRRPRRGRETAVLHGAATARGDPRELHLGAKSTRCTSLNCESWGTSPTVIWQIEAQCYQRRGPLGFRPLPGGEKAAGGAIAGGIDDDRFPVYPQRLVADVREVMPDDGIIALDNGIYKIWFARNYQALLRTPCCSIMRWPPWEPACLRRWRQAGQPQRKVMAVCGDGGFMMNSQELETAVRLGLDLVVLILRDDAYGMIKWKQANMGFDDFGLDYGNPDFVQYACSYGAHGHRADSADGVLPLLETCLSTPGVHLVEVPVDYNENDALSTERSRNAAGRYRRRTVVGRFVRPAHILRDRALPRALGWYA